MGAAAATTKNATATTPSLSRASLGWAGSSIGTGWWFGIAAAALGFSVDMGVTFISIGLGVPESCRHRCWHLAPCAATFGQTLSHPKPPGSL